MKAADDVKEIVIIVATSQGAVQFSLRAECWTTVRVWPERVVNMDVILKEGLLYLQGVKFFKVCWWEEVKVIVPYRIL